MIYRVVGHCDMSSNIIEISFENFEKTRKEWYQSTQQKVPNHECVVKVNQNLKNKNEKKNSSRVDCLLKNH